MTRVVRRGKSGRKRLVSKRVKVLKKVKRVDKGSLLVEEVVREMVGEDVLPLVKVLQKKPSISEFSLADAVKSEINLTRNMLYRLYNVNLVSFVRRKDKKKGWYIYYWTFSPKNIPYLAVTLKKQKLERLVERLEREKRSQFYICGNSCMRLDFEQATEFEFKCPECGELLNLQDNSAKVKELEDSIGVLQKELKV